MFVSFNQILCLQDYILIFLVLLDTININFDTIMVK